MIYNSKCLMYLAKILKCLVFLCCLVAKDATATGQLLIVNGDISFNAPSSGFGGATFSSGDALKFNASGVVTNNVPNTTTVAQSVDINGFSGILFNITGGINSALQLGSVYDSQQGIPVPSGQKITIGIDDGNTLIFSGDNYPSYAPTFHATYPTTGTITGLMPNAYYYNTYLNYQNLSNVAWLLTNSSGSIISEYSGDKLSRYSARVRYFSPNAPLDISGPYNVYSGVDSISVGDNATLRVDTSTSSSGNRYFYSPTVLTNAFTFPGSNSTTTLYLATDLIANSPTIGNFGVIQGSSTLVLNAGSEVTNFSNIWRSGNAGSMMIYLLSDAVITDHSVSGLAYINIGDTLSPYSPTLTIKPQGNWTVSNIYSWGASNFANNGLFIASFHPFKDSTLILDSSGAGDEVHFYTRDNHIGGIESNSDWDSFHANGIDLVGNFKIVSQGNPLTLDLGNGASGSLGYYRNSNIYRLQSLTIEGDKPADIILPVYSQKIILNSSDKIHLIKPAASHIAGMPDNQTGSGGELSLLQEVIPGSSLMLTIGDASSSETSTINLHEHKLNAGTAIIIAGDINPNTSQVPTISIASSLTLNGNVNINTKFDGVGSFGRIIMDSTIVSNNIITASTLNLQNSNINITLDSDSKTVSSSISHAFFASTGNAVIISPNTPANFTSINPHPLYPITWSYDSDTYIITGIGQAVTLPPTASDNANNILTYLTTPTTTTADGVSSLSDAQVAALNVLGASQTLDQAVSNLELLVIANAAEDASVESAEGHFKIINERMLPAIDLLVEPELAEAQGGVSAGDQELKGGVWTIGFLQQATQKTYSNTNGYSLRGFGVGVGADTQLNEDILLGLAWTGTRSVIKLKEPLSPNKINVDINIFSLYGLKAMPYNLVIQGSLSGGFSNTRSKAIRHIGTNITYASSKYKSQYYAGDIELIKDIKFKNSSISCQPSVGLTYSQFTDDAYAEHSGAINWNVAKRKSSNIEGLLGVRVLNLVIKDNWLFKPYLSASTHVNLKDRRGKTHASLDATALGAIAFSQTKASPVWYSGGIGLSIFKNDFEIEAGYEVQYDKKYVGNILVLKFRLEA